MKIQFYMGVYWAFFCGYILFLGCLMIANAKGHLDLDVVVLSLLMLQTIITGLMLPQALESIVDNRLAKKLSERQEKPSKPD